MNTNHDIAKKTVVNILHKLKDRETAKIYISHLSLKNMYKNPLKSQN